MHWEMKSSFVRWWSMALLLACAVPTLAQIVTEPKTERLPPQLGNVSIEQRLNQQVPLGLTFRDESGATVQLNQFFRPGRPVVLSLVYFNCPMLCSQVLESLAHSLKMVKFDAGQQFEVVTVSFDPRDTPQNAAAAKQKYLAMYGHPGAEGGWHFLTGDEASITSLANAVGFHYSWDSRTQQFAHAAGIMVLTPDGRISQYYYGARFFPSDLRLGLIQASQNEIGSLADQLVLYCYHWDPHTGRYGVIVSRVLQISGAVTLLTLGGVLLLLFRRYPNQGDEGDETGREPEPEAALDHNAQQFVSGRSERRRG
jgi:protein SCO1/2